MEDTKALNLAKAREAMAEKRKQGYTPITLSPWDKAKANPTSLKLAIRANCYECVGGEHSELAKLLVRDCGLSEKCSLWPHRPWQDVKGEYKGPEENI